MNTLIRVARQQAAQVVAGGFCVLYVADLIATTLRLEGILR